MLRQKVVLSILMCCLFITAAAKDVIIIKYSFNDCIVCNENIYNLLKYRSQDIPFVICFKNAQYKPYDYDKVYSFLTENKVSVIISDSLYYAFDSSERSKIYALHKGKVTKSEYLKTAKLNDFFPNYAVTYQGNIIAPFLTIIAHSKKYLYLGQSKVPYILLVDKKNLSRVADTLVFFNNQIKRTIFEKIYGNDADDKIRELVEINKRLPIPADIQLYDVIITGNDKVEICLSLYGVTTKPRVEDTIVHIVNLPAVLTFDHKRLIDIQTFNVNKYDVYSHDAIKDKYLPFATQIMQHKGNLVLLVKPDTAHYNSPILAEVAPSGKGYEISDLIRYPIDSSFIDNGIGAGMLYKTYSVPYFVERYSKRLMNLDTRKVYYIPVNAKNAFTKAQFSNMMIRPNYEVVSMYNNGKRLVIAVREDNELKLLTYEVLSNGDIKYTHAKILSRNFQNDSNYNASTTCDEDGIYVYHLDQKNFQLIPYAK